MARQTKQELSDAYTALQHDYSQLREQHNLLIALTAIAAILTLIF
jgi:hypothetical protein